jgi:hypothetical protein
MLETGENAMWQRSEKKKKKKKKKKKMAAWRNNGSSAAYQNGEKRNGESGEMTSMAYHQRRHGIRNMAAENGHLAHRKWRKSAGVMFHRLAAAASASESVSRSRRRQRKPSADAAWRIGSGSGPENANGESAIGGVSVSAK